jgi:hypothetical protein
MNNDSYTEQPLPSLAPRMPLVSQLYPSRYLYAADLNGEAMVAEIARVQEVTLEDKSKIAVHFAAMDKALVLNKTNARAIASLHGDDPAKWISKKIELYPTKVWFDGQMVDCIRIRPALEAPGLEKGQPQ